MKLTRLALILLLIAVPGEIHAQELIQDQVEIFRATVVRVLSTEERPIPGTDLMGIHQLIEVQALEGPQQGELIKLDNDLLALQAGDKLFIRHNTSGLDGRESYTVRDIDRRGTLVLFALLFIIAILLFSGWQGLRSLVSLVGSLLVIMYILIPALLAGYPPVPTSIALATVILFLAIYLTHGFNRESTVAFIGTSLAVVLTGALAYLGVTLAHLSGFASEEAIYLNFNTQGTLDFSGLLLGGIMIGVLGVLDDIAITQAAVVRELHHSAPHLSRKEVYKKSLRVGREHVGALVNTLALAYTGAALPLLLLFSTAQSSASSIINQEVFATEIIRTVVGSIGLILTVPITSLLAVYWLRGHHNHANHASHSRSHSH